MTDADWGLLSDQAVAAAGIVYFLALLTHLAEWASLRTPASAEPAAVGASGGGSPSRPEVRPSPTGAAGGVPRPARADPDPAGRRRPLRGAGRPGHGRGPQPGALGQHVRVHAVRHVRRDADVPRALPPLPARLDVAARGRLRGHVPDGGGDLAARRGRPAAPRRSTPTGWSSTSSRRSSRPVRSPSAGSCRRSTAWSSARPTTTTGPLSRVPSLEALDRISVPHPRLRVPGVDLRRADHRPDLGQGGVVVVLELGPQGGLGVHHLGRLRGVPPRPGHRRLEGPQRRPARAASAWPPCGSTSSASTTSPAPASTRTPARSTVVDLRDLRRPASARRAPTVSGSDGTSDELRVAAVAL